MKSALLSLLVIFTINANAQKVWELEKMDSGQFIETYGSIHQYWFQKDIMRKSSHKELVLFCGAKEVYLNNLSYFLQHNGYSPDFKQGLKMDVLTMKNGITTNNKNEDIVITALINKDRIKSLRITGHADGIISLFLNYWELSGISMDKLKRNKTITKDCGSDRITFSWIGENPIVTVTNNHIANLID